MRSFAKVSINRDERVSFSITLSRKMMELEGKRSFWPSSATVTGYGRLRNVTVDKDEVDDLSDLVDRNGGDIQED